MFDLIEFLTARLHVKNADGTKDDKADEGSNLKCWEEYAKIQNPDCSRLGGWIQHDDEIVGAHIEKVGKENEGLYIIPLCKYCNGQKGKDFYIKKTVPLMHADELHKKSLP